MTCTLQAPVSRTMASTIRFFSVSVFRGDFHLDQLVVFQRLFNLGKHPFGQTIVAKHHYRLERMCQTFKVLFCLVLDSSYIFAYVGIENGSFYRHLPNIAK